MQNEDGVCWLQGCVTGAKVGSVVHTVASTYQPPYPVTFTGWGVQTTMLGSFTLHGLSPAPPTSNAYNPILLVLSTAGAVSVESGTFNGWLDMGTCAYTLA